MVEAVIDWFSSVYSSLRDALSSETTKTIIAGVVVFVLCEWAKEVWLTPIQEFKGLKAKVSYSLVMNARYYANPLRGIERNEAFERYSQASNEMRALASEIAAYVERIPLIHLGIPSAKKIRVAEKNLIGLSNSFFIGDAETQGLHSQHVNDYQKEIKKALRLRNR